MFGEFPEGKLDHRNGDGRDNSKKNIRLATTSQNAMNTKLNINNSSGVKGVYYEKGRDKYVVKFVVDGRNKYFGRYDDLELAELVADEARDKFHKEFARHE